MKALITGINGFAGSHLAHSLLDLGYEVHGVHRVNSSLNSIQDICDKITLWAATVHEKSKLAEIVAAVKPAYIFHLAATRDGSFDDIMLTNYAGTCNLLEAVRCAAATSCRILVVGSSAEYGYVLPDRQPITEDTAFQPISAYGVSKCAMDVVAYFYFARHGLDIIRVRPFNYIGPGQRLGYVCPDLAHKVALAEKKKIASEIKVSNLNHKRDFIDIRDVVQAFTTIIEKAPCGSVYNICSGYSISVREVIQNLIRIAQCPLQIIEDNESNKVAEVPTQIGSYARLVHELAWEPAITFTQSIEDLLKYWRNQIQ